MDLDKIYIRPIGNIIYNYLQPYDIVKFASNKKIKEMKLEYYKPLVKFVTGINLDYYEYLIKQIIKLIITNYKFSWNYEKWVLNKLYTKNLEKILEKCDDICDPDDYLSNDYKIIEKKTNNKIKIINKLISNNNNITKIIEILFVNEISMNKLIFNNILISKELLSKNNIKNIKFINREYEPYNDTRCTNRDKLAHNIMIEKFNPKYIFKCNKDFTIYDLINGFFSVKTSKIDTIYEIFRGVELKKQNKTLIIYIELSYDS